MEELQKEITRCEELLKMYEEIPTGFFGASIIRQKLSQAKEAKTDDEIKMALKDLEELEG